MGILQTLEGIFDPSRKAEETRIELKEIFCGRRDDGYIKRFNTAAVGTAYTNPDGSSRQDTLQKLKPGEKVRLIWNKWRLYVDANECRHETAKITPQYSRIQGQNGER